MLVATLCTRHGHSQFFPSQLQHWETESIVGTWDYVEYTSLYTIVHSAYRYNLAAWYYYGTYKLSIYAHLPFVSGTFVWAFQSVLGWAWCLLHECCGSLERKTHVSWKFKCEHSTRAGYLPMPITLMPLLLMKLKSMSRLSSLCAVTVGALLYCFIFLPVRFSTSRMRTVPSRRSSVKSVTSLVFPLLFSLSFTQFTNVSCCVQW